MIALKLNPDLGTKQFLLKYLIKFNSFFYEKIGMELKTKLIMS